jgi:lipopolysaccharide biosynthesis regulator YciM
MMKLLWLLLPVAAASGWLAAKYSLRTKPTTSSFNLSPDYLKGLNYLLNEEPDKAIDIFIKLIEVDNETVETHLALGTLFRHRGEVNRAIRIHQNLIARPALSPQQRSLALLELGQDYRRAGLLDRAENLFLELVASTEHRAYAYRQLLDIYQQEHDWDKATHTAQKLAQVANEPMRPVIAQYHCEQAEIFRQQGHREAALTALQLALKTDPHCVRASLLEGTLASEEGHREQAILAFKRVEQQDPTYLTEVIEPLQTCYQQIGRPHELTLYLRHILENYGGISPMLLQTNLIKQQEGERPAVDFIVKQLHQHPSLRGLDQLLDLVILNPLSITGKHLLLLKDMTTQLLKNKPIYKCHHCGFTGKNLHWQCPSCKQWNTIKPIE